MKKVIFAMIFLGTIVNANAQFLNFGIKGGLNYNSNGDLVHDVNHITINPDSDTGFHFGVFSEIDLPLGLYLRPELSYAHTKSDYDNQGTLSIDKIDVPILVGLEFFNFARVFIGPSFQYIIDADLKGSEIYDDIDEKGVDAFSMGVQFGVGVEFGKFGVDLRWERGITDTEARYLGIDNSNVEFKSVTSKLNSDITIDTRPQQFILGVYYKFR